MIVFLSKLNFTRKKIKLINYNFFGKTDACRRVQILQSVRNTLDIRTSKYRDTTVKINYFTYVSRFINFKSRIKWKSVWENKTIYFLKLAKYNVSGTTQIPKKETFFAELLRQFYQNINSFIRLSCNS